MPLGSTRGRFFRDERAVTPSELWRRRRAGLKGSRCCYESPKRACGAPAIFSVYTPPFDACNYTHACLSHLVSVLTDSHEHRIFWAADEAAL